MANWKLGKLQYGLTQTATSGGTLALTASSKQYQVLTGTMDHIVKLPDATTIGVGVGVGFTISNQSTGIVIVQLDDNSVFATLPAGQSLKCILTDASTSNGVWRTAAAGGGSGGIASVEPGSLIATNYVVQAADNGRVLNVNTDAGSILITLPVPESGFKITIKDAKGSASANPIIIERNGSELIDGNDLNDQIDTDFTAFSLVSDGTDWYRIAEFVGIAPFDNVFALFGGGWNGSIAVDVIDYTQTSTLGNATNFGNLTVAREYIAALASSTRGVFGGGSTTGTLASSVDTIDYVTIATASNAIDFGDLSTTKTAISGSSSETRGLFNGGGAGGPTYYNVIDYVTIATLGNATDFGDLTVARYGTASCNSTTRSVTSGGWTGSASNVIDYVTIASVGNATDFGDLTPGAKHNGGGSGSSTRGIMATWFDSSTIAVDEIDYITIASIGNSSDFGNLSVSRAQGSSASSKTRALFAGGTGPSNVIDYVTIATTGNAIDFGDLSVARLDLGGCSNGHGGL